MVVAATARPGRGQPKRLNWVHAGLSAWMALALLTSIELYFALVYDASDSFNMTNVSKKWFKLHVEPQQHALKFSEREGVVFRDDREYPKKLAADQRHIVFFGDSFTFAQGVSEVRDRFSNRVRAAIEPESQGKILVSNLADAGKDLHWNERVMELLFANGHRVDTAVYVLCLNDIETFHERHQTYYQDLNWPTFFLFRDTYFFNWVYFRVRQATLPQVRGYFADMAEYYSGEPWQAHESKVGSSAATLQSQRDGLSRRGVSVPAQLGAGLSVSRGSSEDRRVLSVAEHSRPGLGAGVDAVRLAGTDGQPI